MARLRDLYKAKIVPELTKQFSYTNVMAVPKVVKVVVSMGIGKASVYTYIPQYFPKDVGTVGGLVGAVGGLGGFVLPLLFAWAKEQTGRPESTWYVMVGLGILSTLTLSIAVARIHADAHHGEM